jgi:exopolyphosphatase / guanosine-5'-triphosphate,3'-diphosphate pyrophosphatase
VAEIVPRWEWRTFGDAFPDAERLLKSLTPERAQDSNEVYLLSAHSDASAKLREDVVDVKQLQQVNDDGLELWKPILKASFPLSAEETETVLTALSIHAAPLARDSYTVEDFAHEIVTPDPDLRLVIVHKQRTHYRVDDCMVERSQIETDGQASGTIAIESPDAELVIATIARLGLAGRRNVNMASGLKSLVGFGGHRHAVVDVGTNSVKFFLGELEADGNVEVIDDRSVVTRLGEGLDASGRLSDDAMQRTAAAIEEMVAEARAADVTVISIVGTAGMRAASNSAEFNDRVRDATGRTIEVISGDEEARLAYLAAMSALPELDGQLVVFDSGGGSTQFSFGHRDAVDERVSVDLGAARISERFGLAGAVSAEIVSDACNAIANEFAVLDGHAGPDAIVGMGGTVTNLAAVKHALSTYDAEVVHGTVLDLDEIDRQIELYRTRDAAAREEIAGLQPNRAPVILGGACIARTILSRLGKEELTVSDRALRHGVFADRVARSP